MLSDLSTPTFMTWHYNKTRREPDGLMLPGWCDVFHQLTGDFIIGISIGQARIEIGAGLTFHLMWDSIRNTYNKHTIYQNINVLCFYDNT